MGLCVQTGLHPKRKVSHRFLGDVLLISFPLISHTYTRHIVEVFFIVFKSINPHIEYFKTGEKRSKWASLPSISKFLIGDFGVVKTQPNW